MSNSLWVELHIEMPRHPKTTALARALKVSRREAIGLLADFWTWAIHCADETGLLQGVADEDLAIVLDWPRKKAADLTGALKAVGWIQGESGAFILHNWPNYTGKLYERRRDAQRKREMRRRSQVQQTASPICPGTAAGQGADMSGGNPGASPPNPRAGYNQTKPNQTCSSQGDYCGDSQPPTAQEVRVYVDEIDGRVDPVRFVDYYSTSGWQIKGQAVKDWRALVRLWEKREVPKREAGFDLADFERLNVFDIKE